MGNGIIPRPIGTSAPAPGVFPPSPPAPRAAYPSLAKPAQQGAVQRPLQNLLPPGIIPKHPGDTIKSKDGNTYVVLEKTVRRKGDSAWRCNNPSNLTADKSFPEAWSYGCYPNKNLWGRFVIFATLDLGWDGVHQFMQKREKMTVLSYAEAHAPRTEPGNDPDRYARIFVKYALGIQGEDKQNAAARATTVKQLLEAGWPEKLHKAFNEAEGFKIGEELDFDDLSLPPDVGSAVRAGRVLP